MSLRHTLKRQFYTVQRQLARQSARPAPDRPANRVIVFAMHSISDAHSDMSVTPARFREQMTAVLEAGYRPVAMDDLREILDGRKRPEPAFAVTFDDGYENTFTQALPILEELSIPAAVFLTTGFLDGTAAPPWRSTNAALLAEYQSQTEHFRPMSWRQAGELARHPMMRIGSHTVSHPMLGAVTESTARDEIVKSRAILCEKLGVVSDAFAYPFGIRRYGAYSDTTERLLREAGYRCSLTSEISRAVVGNGPWKIPRISLTEEDTGMDALAKAAGGYDWVGKAQSLYQSIFPNPHQVKDS